ncbi:hypothetical protein T4A_5121 [Trichinella pseudospiralis]|uniref:Uncharacterized protein n=1 Tax=Trichinella pseudospiralis TaxID=6337 RepID=A0A0V0XWU2_TRIPS|nr:hypothetical protein T4E_10171 [Trichinella pseudospiralis]KRY73786.1 hypothetical protein T4A_5121 [Trichinella pseudospiralis]
MKFSSEADFSEIFGQIVQRPIGAISNLHNQSKKDVQLLMLIGHG